MKWKKLGKIFVANSQYDWMQSHASNPVALHLIHDNFRIYFSTRDVLNRSRIGYLDIDINEPMHVINLCEKPLFELGGNGSFDNMGASMGCIIEHEEQILLYYLGWNLPDNVPFRNSIGIVTSDKENNFKKPYHQGPLLDRNLVDPYSLSYPFVIQDGGKYKMWYGSHKKWGETSDDMVHCIKYAESNNGIHWERNGKICIDTTNVDYAFSRPSVLKEKELYKMWYSYRGSKYRIGYAESSDGVNWKRMDEKVGIDVSDNGWDNEMIEYPFVFDHKGNRYMLYNGNGYGKTGFGIAVLESN